MVNQNIRRVFQNKLLHRRDVDGDDDDVIDDDDNSLPMSESNSISESSEHSMGSACDGDDDDCDDDSDDETNHTNTNRLQDSLLDSMAIFGHDKTALLGSFAVLVLSFIVSMHLNGHVKIPLLDALLLFQQQQSSSKEDLLYKKLGPVPTIDYPPVIYHVNDLLDSPSNLTLLRQAYDKDGVVAIRGLIDDDDPSLLKRLDESSARHVKEQWDKQAPKNGKPRRQKQGTQFFTNINQLALTDPPFPSFSSNCSVADDEASDSSNEERMSMNPFLQVALFSQIPQMAATLLGLEDEDKTNTVSSSSSSNDNSNNNNLRLIRDIFLAKDADPYICGWHVDDYGFWPATPESPGINAWIALDNYNVDVDGGGFALAVGSHTASWRHEAQHVTGASTTAPPEGFTSAKDLFTRRTGSGTCNLKSSAPHLHRRMEETKRIYPHLRKGDVILHHRWLFHRTVALNRDFVQEQQQHQKDEDNSDVDSAPPPTIMRRYSIRYGPGTSVVPPGFGTELSVLWDDKNGGKTADQVCSGSGGDNEPIIYPWYPQAWPQVLDRELQSMESLVKNQFPVALQRQERHLQEMKPHRKRLARQQHEATLAGNRK